MAVAANGVIGKENTLPWRLPEDLKYFKRITMGHPIVMGRLTFDSIGRPLPGRTNIVVTRQDSWVADGVEVAHGLDEALAIANKAYNDIDWLMLIGGANLYEQALPQCKRLYLTEVHADVDGDAYFPKIDQREWVEVSRELHKADETNPYDYSFVVLDRVS